MHGARKKKTIKQGADHPQFKHGKRSHEYMAQQSEQIAELQALEEISYRIGMMVGPKTRGPKTKKHQKTMFNLYDKILAIPSHEGTFQKSRNKLS